jgi:hypothetical protein
MKDPGMKLRMEAPVITLGMEEPSSKFEIEDPGRVWGSVWKRKARGSG